MKLLNIKLNGFKSFAGTSLFPITAPLTGVIGPNGCGKSNVIDAVRWVLGENAAKQLRGQNANDVIFAGSNDRKPANYASVELLFDNSEHKLLNHAYSEFDEISVSRKITQDGQSIYQINGKIVRRRDVVELLQMVGVSARGYAVIEQGMISRIIESKPEDVRTFIEDAAGIAIYKNRRKETEVRLEDVAQLLERHDERLFTLEKQRNQLAAEAETAAHFQQLNLAQEEKTTQLQSFQFKKLTKTITEANAEIAKTEHKLNDIKNSTQQDKLHAALALFEQAQNLAQHQEVLLKQAENQFTQQTQHIEKIKLRIQFNREKALTQQENAGLLQQQIVESEKEISQLNEQIRAIELNISAHAPQVLQLQQFQQETLQKYEEKRAAIRERKIQLQALNERKNRLKQEQQNQHTQLQNWLSRRSQLQNQPPILVEDFDEESLMIVSEKLENINLSFEEAFDLLNILETEQQQKNEQMQTLKSVIEYTRGQISALEKLQPQQISELPRVLDQIEIQTEWQHALASYLHHVLQGAFGTDILQALDRKENLAGAGEIPTQWQAIIKGNVDLSFFLGNIFPLNQYNKEIKTLPDSRYYLTLDGTLVSKNTVLHGHQQQWSNLLTLKNELPQQEQEYLEAATGYQKISDQLILQKNVVQKIDAQRSQLQQEWQNLRNQSQLHLQHKKHAETLQIQQAEQLRTLNIDIENGELHHEELANELLLLEENILLLQIDNGDELLNNDESSRAQSAYQLAEQSQRERQQNLIRLQTQQQSLITQVNKQREEIQQQAFKNTINQTEQLELENELQDAIVLAEEFSVQIVEFKELLQEKTSAAQQLKQTLREQEKLVQNDLQQQEILQQRLELQLAQVQQLEEQATNLRAELSEIVEVADDLDIAALKNQIREIKNAIQALGAVNLAAIEQFEIIKAEYDELATQVADLRTSVEMLQGAIVTLDNETRERLKTTFNNVNQYFGEHIARLFSGGIGVLTWSCDDVLTAGVNIHVALNGKKNRHLSALSGGEKALAALSLVFALFRLSPAPFCLLDEVDAPLDDANVGRLALLLQEISHQTQLVVITHHKKTMQACHALIGVTMSELGVSRFVGVNLG